MQICFNTGVANQTTVVQSSPEKRNYLRKRQVNVFCLVDDEDEMHEIVEISAHGFSFTCEQGDRRFRPSVALPDVSILDGESQEIIHASGVIRHRSEFDSRRDRVGVSFESKRYDKTVTGQVRLPRRKPQTELTVRFVTEDSSINGTVVDVNVRSARIYVGELAAMASAGYEPFVPGQSLAVTVATETRPLYSGAATVTRAQSESGELVVEFTEGLIDLRLITIAEKAQYALGIIAARGDAFSQFDQVRDEFKALVADWRMYFQMVEEVLSQEEAKRYLAGPEDERRYIEDLESEIFARFRGFIGRLNAIVPTLETEAIEAHKQYLRSSLEPFIRRSTLACSIIDKIHGYHGDFETVKQFFADPFAGASLFGKLMNRFIISLEPVQAHVNRIGVLHDEILSHYERSSDGIRVFSLGAGPAEEILRVVQDQELEKPIHVTLVDVDSHALADFYERVQYVRNEMVQIELVNFNVIDILVGKSIDVPPASYDLTYCAGMYDYFKDRFCRKFTAFLIDLTRAGGTFLYTNVHSRNFARYFMDYGGGWEIYHRDEAQTRVLTPEGHDVSSFTDETGTNVFVRGVKQ